MNITLLANRDLPACVALNYLVPALNDHSLSLILSSRVGRAAVKPRPLQELAFFEQTLFNDLLFPALDNGAGPRDSQFRTFQELAAMTGQPLQVVNQINQGTGFDRFAATRPDLVISIRYGAILDDPVISLPAQGVLNLHSGLLPGYRGVMASFWAMLNGEGEIGTTLHYIDDTGIDTGRIIECTRMPVNPARSYFAHVLDLYGQGCAGLLRAIAALQHGQQLPTRPQGEGGRYFTFPSAAELADFTEQGLSLVHPEEVREIASRFLNSDCQAP